MLYWKLFCRKEGYKLTQIMEITVAALIQDVKAPLVIIFYGTLELTYLVRDPISRV